MWSEIKTRHLSELTRAIRAGGIDDGALGCLNQINELDGMVTTQCCIGHEDREDPTGFLSIRTDAERTKLFDTQVIPALMEQPFIVDIFRCYEIDKDHRVWFRYVFIFKCGCMEKLVSHLMGWDTGNPLYRNLAGIVEDS